MERHPPEWYYHRIPMTAENQELAASALRQELEDMTPEQAESYMNALEPDELTQLTALLDLWAGE